MTLGEGRETGTYEVPAVLGMGGGNSLCPPENLANYSGDTVWTHFAE